MQSTSVSLLERVKDRADREAWSRLVELYAPFLQAWGRRNGLNDTDAMDLTQDVLTILAQKMPEFDYDASKSFRSWLKTITVNRAKNYHRAAANRPTIGVDSAVGRAASVESEADIFEKEEYQSVVSKRLLEFVRREFREQDWKAFQMLCIQERSGAEVAEELGITVNTAYLAKSRILQRLRTDGKELLD